MSIREMALKLSTRDIAVFVDVFAWIGYGALILLPRKLRILKRHGFDKTSEQLMELAETQTDIRSLVRHTRTYIGVGLIVGLALVLSRYF
jgi:hypothetical protein